MQTNNIKIKPTQKFHLESISERIIKIPLIGNIILWISDIIFSIIHRIAVLFYKGDHKLVIISFHRLGDTVFTIPAIKEIFNHYRNFNKTILCYPDSKKIYELVFSEQIITLIKDDFKYGTRLATSKGRKLLRKLNPEIIFDLTGTITSASLIYNSSAKKILGTNERIFRKIYTAFKYRRKIPHLIDNYLDIAELDFKYERSENIYEFKADINKNGILLIHPFAIRNAKEWNLEKYIELAEKLNLKFNVELISPENFLDEKTKKEIIKKGITINVTKSLDELISLIKRCSVFISNDTGPLYIANLMGKATFTIYGPTNPDYSFPFGENHMFVRKLIECSPIKDQFCFTLAGIYCPMYECMNLLSIDEVFEKLNKFLDRLGIIRKAEYSHDKNK